MGSAEGSSTCIGSMVNSSTVSGSDLFFSFFFFFLGVSTAMSDVLVNSNSCRGCQFLTKGVFYFGRSKFLGMLDFFLFLPLLLDLYSVIIFLDCGGLDFHLFRLVIGRRTVWRKKFSW